MDKYSVIIEIEKELRLLAKSDASVKQLFKLCDNMNLIIAPPNVICDIYRGKFKLFSKKFDIKKVVNKRLPESVLKELTGEVITIYSKDIL